MGMEKITQWAS